MAKRLRLTLTSALIALTTLSAAAAAPAASELSNTVSQHFGLLVGDRITQQVRVAVPASHSIERSALPKKGRANRWFELHDIAFTETSAGAQRNYTLTLQYQVVTSDDIISLAALPRPLLRFTAAGAQPLALRIGEQHVSVSAITDIDAWDRAGLQALRPEHGTPLMDTTATRQRIAAYAAALGLLALYWLYRVYGVPFLARSRGPFARAWRALRREHSADSVAVQGAMRQLHRAFDATFGKSVFGGEVDAFLAQHPRYSAQRAAIQRFFDASRRAFYGTGDGGQITLAELRELAQRLSMIERGLA